MAQHYSVLRKQIFEAGRGVTLSLVQAKEFVNSLVQVKFSLLMTCSCYLLVCIGQKTHITFVDVGQYAAAMHLIDRYCWGGQGVIHVGLKLKF